MRKFQKNKEDFTCEHCGQEVKGTGYTNHCPRCLYSKHVDIHPGDREAKCGGLMSVTDIDYKKGKYIFIHTCRTCGYKKKNQQTDNDSLEEILRISKNLHRRVISNS